MGSGRCVRRAYTLISAECPLGAGGEIGWSKPVLVVGTYRLGQARTLIDAPGRMMRAARLRSWTESPLSSQYFSHSAWRLRLSANESTGGFGGEEFMSTLCPREKFMSSAQAKL
jgi:hypothetical protein